MEDDIYDDSSNIRNVTAVSRMKSLFEAPAADTKPFRPPPKKIMRPMPGATNRVPPSLPPKGDKAEEDGKTANGTAEGTEKSSNITSEIPSWKNRVDMFNKTPISSLPPKTAKSGLNNTTSPVEKRDENSNTVSANTAQRSSKVNIPTAFSGANNNTPPPPPPITPKKPLVFPKPTEKTDTSPGNQVSSVKDKPIIPRKGITPAQGAFDFQDELKRKLSGKGNDFKSGDKKQDDGQKEPLKPGKLNRDNVLALQKKISGSAATEEASDSEKVFMRPKSGSKFPNRKSVKRKSLTRTNDGSKFYLVEMSLDDNTEKKKLDEEPDIPPPLEYSDLQRLHEIILEYKVALRELEGNPAEDADIIEEIEDVYEAIPADMDEPPPVPPPHKKLSRAVSLIKPMSEKEEYDSDDQDTYDDTGNFMPKEPPSVPLPPPPELDLPAPPDELLKPPVPEGPIPTRRKPSNTAPVEKKPAAETPPPLVPQKDDWPDDVYDDCTTEANQDTAEAELEQDDVYEAIPGEGESNPPPTPEKPEEKKEEKKDEKLSAKEKKKREKEEAERLKAEKKRQEAEKKRQEKELKEIKKNFKIDTAQLDKSQGEGMLKEDAVPSGGKTSKLELTAKKGSLLNVVRLVDNPPGKWLVRLMEEKSDKPVYLSQIVGYVDANIVEVMAGSFVSALNNANITDGEEYQDVEVEIPPVEEEMYEAV